jgi:His-Xaa-Ser system radical SAM maturase HxsC
MRKLKAMIDPKSSPGVHRVVDIEQLAAEWTPDLRFFVRAEEEHIRQKVVDLQKAGLKNSFWIASELLAAGDIVVATSSNAGILVLYRETDTHHALLLTNRCNSYCLMCSQPPTTQNDAWLIDEALDVIRHMKNCPPVIGLTGGEPLLEKAGLRKTLDAIYSRDSETRIEVLTNGRLFCDSAVVESVLSGLQAKVRWLVPLYGHADFLHDFVVQSPGAYEQTIAGLLALQENRQPIQLRIVLIEPVLRVLDELCGFIARNLPFVSEVALMGCEPIGFALANRETCEVDLCHWEGMLIASSKILRRHDIRHIFMNMPLCVLPKQLWPISQKSISDWKNNFPEECNKCSVKTNCSGLFVWHERGWKPGKIRAIEALHEQIH